MIIRSQNIECDVFTQTAKPVHFVQGEKGREVMFTFVNSAIPIEDEPQPILLSGLTATIHILKPDGNFIIDNMTINGNAALYTLGENACAAGGAGVYDVSLSKGSDVVYTAHGAYVGDFRAISDDVVNSVSEAYGVTFPEGFQEKLIAGEHITIDGNVISAEGERYTAGPNIQISDENVISATDTRYTAGDNIQISDENVISASFNNTIANNVPRLNYLCDFGSNKTLITHFFENGQANSHWSYDGSAWVCDQLTTIDIKAIISAYVVNIDANNNYSVSATQVTYLGNGRFTLNFGTSNNTFIIIDYIGGAA